MITRTIFFHDLVVQARIGILEHEKCAPQPLHINAEFEVIAQHAADDNELPSVLDYRWLRESMLSVWTHGHVRLLEALIERMATRMVNEFAGVQRLQISLGKSTVSADGGAVGITIARERCSGNPMGRR